MSVTPECTCKRYVDIELSRADVDQRIGDSRTLRKHLRFLVESPDKLKRLYECEGCKQLWQESEAWGWDNWDEPIHLFKVPTVSIDEWLQEQYIQPHELLVFSACIERVLKGAMEKKELCVVVGCTGKAIAGSLNCLPHHVLSLQKVRLLPQFPKGRWFRPYSRQRFRLEN
jgi:hypothetical protein